MANEAKIPSILELTAGYHGYLRDILRLEAPEKPAEPARIPISRDMFKEYPHGAGYIAGINQRIFIWLAATLGFGTELSLNEALELANTNEKYLLAMDKALNKLPRKEEIGAVEAIVSIITLIVKKHMSERAKWQKRRDDRNKLLREQGPVATVEGVVAGDPKALWGEDTGYGKGVLAGVNQPVYVWLESAKLNRLMTINQLQEMLSLQDRQLWNFDQYIEKLRKLGVLDGKDGGSKDSEGKDSESEGSILPLLLALAVPILGGFLK